MTMRGEQMTLFESKTERKCTWLAKRKSFVCVCGCRQCADDDADDRKQQGVRNLRVNRWQTCVCVPFCTRFQNDFQFQIAFRPFDISIRSKTIVICKRMSAHLRHYSSSVCSRHGSSISDDDRLGISCEQAHPLSLTACRNVCVCVCVEKA